jgi:lysophospholipid acyltransferase (LPLAT)-like uncharacterized protein
MVRQEIYEGQMRVLQSKFRKPELLNKLVKRLSSKEVEGSDRADLRVSLRADGAAHETIALQAMAIRSITPTQPRLG